MGVIHDKLLTTLAFAKSVTFTLPDIHIFSCFVYSSFYVWQHIDIESAGYVQVCI